MENAVGGAKDGGIAGEVRDGGGADGVQAGGRPSDAPAAPKAPRLIRLRFWWSRLRIRLAIAAAGRDTIITLDKGTYTATMDELARFVEWVDKGGVFHGAPQKARALEERIETVTRLLVLAAEMGDPSLQLEGAQQRYVNIRLRAMSRRKRERLGYEAGLKALEAKARTPAERAERHAGRAARLLNPSPRQMRHLPAAPGRPSPAPLPGEPARTANDPARRVAAAA